MEDENKIARYIQLECQHAGYDAATENDGKRAWSRIVQEDWDIVLLDVMLPGMFGTEVCRAVRQCTDVPIIMLTARGEVGDKVEGLDCGADDYIVKPFVAEELLARMRAVQRRKTQSNARQSAAIVFKNISIYPERFEAYCNQMKLALTKKEFDLLYALVANRNIVLTRERILQMVWGDDFVGSDNVVDVYIRYVRSKLETYDTFDIITTVRGVGYVARDE